MLTVGRQQHARALGPGLVAEQPADRPISSRFHVEASAVPQGSEVEVGP